MGNNSTINSKTRLPRTDRQPRSYYGQDNARHRRIHLQKQKEYIGDILRFIKTKKINITIVFIILLELKRYMLKQRVANYLIDVEGTNLC